MTSRRFILELLVLFFFFQTGRIVERAVLPCRLRPIAEVVTPLLGKPMPSKAICDLVLKLPTF